MSNKNLATDTLVKIQRHESEGFAQLGYQLFKIGSHVIEQKLIVYRTQW